MVQVKIRIEATSVNDPYARYHGKDIDNPLDETFWNTEPDKIIGTTRNTFSHEQTVDLAPGDHYVEYGNSGNAGYYWNGVIYVNDQKVAEGPVDRRRHIRGSFKVEGAPPTPPPPIPIPQIPLEWLIFGGIAGAIVIAGIASYVATRERAKP